MAPAGPWRGQVVLHARWKDVDLLGEERDEGGRRAFADLQRSPWITQVAEHQREAETVMVAPAAADQGKVTGWQRILAHQVTMIDRWIEQYGDLGFGQLWASRH
jgi:hypothetical protein